MDWLKRNLKDILFYSLVTFFAVLLICMQKKVYVNAASEISMRIEEIHKVYPEQSVFDSEVLVNVMRKYGNEEQYSMQITLGGCNGLVGYVTMKIFHNPFTPITTDSYKKIGDASSSDAHTMNKIFSKAKPGDVVEWKDNEEPKHYAIFLSSDINGIYVYEANFGGKNKVKYQNYWKWRNMKSWSHGAEQVTVWRSRNYNQVNKKKAAVKLKKGSVFTINDITYKVLANSTSQGRVKVISGSKNIPKAIGLRYDMNKFLSKYADEDGTRRTRADGEKEYFKWPEGIMDEQYFIVER